MDGSRFDAFVRSLGVGTRRRVLQLAASTGLGAALLRPLGAEEAAAKCVNPGKKCRTKNGKKKKCCGGAKCRGKKCRRIPVGGKCDPDVPDACVSGVCGCTGEECTCRKADCGAPDAPCVRDIDCCTNNCLGNNTCND